MLDIAEQSLNYGIGEIQKINSVLRCGGKPHEHIALTSQ